MAVMIAKSLALGVLVALAVMAGLKALHIGTTGLEYAGVVLVLWVLAGLLLRSWLGSHRPA